MDYFGDGIDFGVNISYVEQNAQLGTAHAIKQAEHLIDDKFLVLNGDNLIEADAISDMLGGASGDATLLTVVREQTIGYGVVLQEKRKVSKIIEKPREKISHLVNTGIYRFSPSIFNEIDNTPISETGEYAITDTIQRIIDAGGVVTHVTTHSTWIDAVHSWDLLKANAVLLGKQEKSIAGTIEDGTVIIGDVVMGINSMINVGAVVESRAMIDPGEFVI